MTFAQIQEQQRMAIEAEQETIRNAAAARRSFLDIQEEERLAEEQRKEEQKQAEEFEKWFAEESKRLQKQSKGSGKASAPGGGKGKGQKKPSKQQQQAQEPAQPGSANGKSQNGGGKKGGTSKAGHKEPAPNGKTAEADGSPHRNAGKQRQDVSNGAESGNKATTRNKEKGAGKGKGQNSSNGDAQQSTPSTLLQHGLPPKPATGLANMSAAAPTFTPRQP